MLIFIENVRKIVRVFEIIEYFSWEEEGHYIVHNPIVIEIKFKL